MYLQALGTKLNPTSSSFQPQQPESSESPHGQQLASTLLPTPGNLGSGRRPLQVGHDLDHDPSWLRPGGDVRRQGVGRVGGVDDHAERAAVGAAAVDAAAADGASAAVDGVGDYRIPQSDPEQQQH